MEDSSFYKVLKLVYYLSIQADTTCSISHLFITVSEVCSADVEIFCLRLVVPQI